MHVAIRSFTTVYDSEHITIGAGECVASDHELVARYPDEFITEDDARRMSALRAAAGDPRRHEAGASFGPEQPSTDSLTRARDEALDTIEYWTKRSKLSSEAADRLDNLVTKKDPEGIDARYLRAVGDPDYNSAFGKFLQEPSYAYMRFTVKEQEAWQRVQTAESQRALASGTPASGGFAIPFTLDPTIILTSDGALNPIRQVAKVITIGTRQWKGVSSAGVTASYDSEGAEVSDDSPTLGQPVITTAMGRAFVPGSIEIFEDWASIQEEMARLFADARDVLDATKFLTGSGTDEPEGVLTGLTTAQRVLTAGTAAYALADMYSLKQALPARFMARATFAAHPNVLDSTFRFVGGGSTEPAPLPLREGPMLGKQVVEWTTMQSGVTTTGNKIAIYGDWQAGFVVADRTGASLELVSHLFGPNQRPTGERGLFMHWRSGSKTVNPAALRYLEVK
jgi:HK97 family phage major capsid protein